MGALNSKSPQERRNTILRRSQRKSVHGTRAKTDKLIKDIKKFKGTEEDSGYIELKAKIEALERNLKQMGKNLQPQIRPIYDDSLKKTQACYQMLEDVLKENQEKADKSKEEDVVFVEDLAEKVEQDLANTTDKRKTVELTLVQVQPIESSPQFNKRASLIKIGVPVMPDSMMEALRHQQDLLGPGLEEKIAEIRRKLEDLEVEISQFVGRKNGKYYNKIKGQLEGYSNQLNGLPQVDEAIVEQVKMCHNYISSCLSFLDEKAVDDENSDSEEENFVSAVDNNNLSPRSMRTTYI